MWMPSEHIAGAFSLNSAEKEMFLSLLDGRPLDDRDCTPMLTLLTEPRAQGGRTVKRRILTFIAHPDTSPQNTDLKLFYPEMGASGLCFDPGESEPLSRLVKYAKNSEGAHLICVHGARGSGRSSLIRFAACENGQSVLFAGPPRADTDFERIKLECLLLGAAVCFCDASLDEDGLTALTSSLYPAVRLVFFTAENPLPELNRDSYFTANLPMPPVAEEKRPRLWRAISDGFPLHDSLLSAPDIPTLTPGQMKAALRGAFSQTVAEGRSSVDKDAFLAACRGLRAEKLSGLGVLLSAAFKWDDLVLEEPQRKLLTSASDRIKNSPTVYGKWGFGNKLPYGAGLKLLLSGPPGTGKTMAAIVLANDLALPLLKIDSSAVMSKYIGETEKNLSRVFAAAAEASCILLFDEADSLFGKRTDTKDSHDRYANLQTSFLLQKLEEYSGTVILTTNLLKNFDEAFTRRFHYIIRFSLPDISERELLWKNIFPAETPVGQDFDPAFLAENFELSGGSIKNIALSAAFYAAAEDEAVCMAHILRALREECEKTGIPLSGRLLML